MFYLTKQYLKRNNWRLIKTDGSLRYAIKELMQIIKSDIGGNAKHYMNEHLFQWFLEEKIFLDEFEYLLVNGKIKQQFDLDSTLKELEWV